jgi:hypothetical protein
MTSSQSVMHEPSDARQATGWSALAAALTVMVLVCGLALLAGSGNDGDTAVRVVAVEGPSAEVVPRALLPATGDDPVPESTTALPATPVPTTSRVRPPPLALPTLVHQVAYAARPGPFAVYRSPGGAPFTVLDHPRLINGDPNAQVPLLFLVRRDLGEWLEVYVPVRPNGSTGYVRRSDVTISTHAYRIEIYLSDHNLKVFNGTNLVMDTSIGVARASAPTPGGIFFTTELLQPPDPSGPYGPYAFGLSGYSEVYTSFAGGSGQLGIHGTNQPSSIGRNVSNGCIRLRNDDISKLAAILPLGVPVLVNE